MLLRSRRKKLGLRAPAGAAWCAWPRLRPCCAKRCRPKISERIGGSRAPRGVPRMSSSAAGASGSQRCSSDGVTAQAKNALTPISSATKTKVVTSRGATKPCIASVTQRAANKRPLAPSHWCRWLPSADSSMGDVWGIVAKRSGAPAWRGGRGGRGGRSGCGGVHVVLHPRGRSAQRPQGNTDGLVSGQGVRGAWLLAGRVLGLQRRQARRRCLSDNRLPCISRSAFSAERLSLVLAQ